MRLDMTEICTEQGAKEYEDRLRDERSEKIAAFDWLGTKDFQFGEIEPFYFCMIINIPCEPKKYYHGNDLLDCAHKAMKAESE